MRGMKKTYGEFQENNVCRVLNDVQVMSNMCMAPETVVKARRKSQRMLWKTSRVSAKEIVAILMMVLGMLAIIFSFVEVYFMEYYQFYSQYVIMNLDGAFIVLISGFMSFICGIRLALT